jgi:hypothetical protein
MVAGVETRPQRGVVGGVNNATCILDRNMGQRRHWGMGDVAAVVGDGEFTFPAPRLSRSRTICTVVSAAVSRR